MGGPHGCRVRCPVAIPPSWAGLPGPTAVPDGMAFPNGPRRATHAPRGRAGVVSARLEYPPGVVLPHPDPPGGGEQMLEFSGHFVICRLPDRSSSGTRILSYPYKRPPPHYCLQIASGQAVTAPIPHQNAGDPRSAESDAQQRPLIRRSPRRSGRPGRCANAPVERSRTRRCDISVPPSIWTGLRR
jgi:hypothetical protein